jgi:16S rRNA (uracil1498-N3)-methyltransferase
MPLLTEFRHLQDALCELPAQRYICSPGSPPTRPDSTDVAVLIGPEGGLGEEELVLAVSEGFEPLGLSPWTLRADTAVAAALTRLSFNF